MKIMKKKKNMKKKIMKNIKILIKEGFIPGLLLLEEELEVLEIMVEVIQEIKEEEDISHLDIGVEN